LFERCAIVHIKIIYKTTGTAIISDLFLIIKFDNYKKTLAKPAFRNKL